MRIKSRLLPMVLATTATILSGPARAQLSVFDSVNAANTAKSVGTELKSLAQQIQSVEQAILQTEQLIKDAAGLANLSTLLSALGLDPLQVTADQLRMVLSGAYAVDANSANFTNQIRQQLQQSFTIPLTMPQITQLATSSYPNGNSVLLTQYAAKIRDFSTASQYQNVLNNAQVQAASLHQQVQSQLASAQGLGDGSMTASLHSLLAQSGTGLRQADLALNYNAIMADKLTQDELRRLEQEVTLLESSVAATQANTSMRQGAFQTGQ
jgi:hypothetical protein